MGRVNRFEDLVAWQRGKQLAVDIYLATRKGTISRDLGLAGQLQRSAVSIPSNIAEGCERGTPGEFHHGLATAKGSCGELRTQLYIARDIGYLPQEEAATLLTQAEEVSRITGALRSAVQRQRNTRRTTR